MPTESREFALRWILGAAALCLVIAGMKLASSIIVPLLLAAVIAVICLPSLQWLQNRGVPTVLAISVVLLVVASVAVLLPVFVGASLRNFLADMGSYHYRIMEIETQAIDSLVGMGFENAQDFVDDWLNPGAARKVLEDAGKGLLYIFANAFLVLILVGFMLAEASHFRTKVQTAFPDSTTVSGRITEVIANIWRYLAIKTVISIATGVTAALLLWLLGVEYPLLWGFLAFCLNYIPNVGSFIASIPPIALAALDLGWASAAGVAVGYLIINNVYGSLMEPRLQGQGLGLSPLVVLISLLFWHFVLGIVGALLSAPLTMAVKIACEANPETEWIAVMLGGKVKSSREKQPASTTSHL